MAILLKLEKGRILIDTYNGYKNYFTWAASLWISNEEYSYLYFREQAKHIKAETDEKAEQVYLMANFIQEFIEENAPEIKASVYSDLLDCAIRYIDFHEIAESILDE